MQKIFVFLLILAVPLLIFLYLFQGDEPLVPTQIVNTDKPAVRIGNVPVRVDIADTATERELGLSGRTSLGETEGLLFIFDESDYHGIWMKDMQFSIDVIWIDEHFRVVDIEPDLKPDTYPRKFEPDAPARFIIETNANYVDSFGITVGDEVVIPSELIPEDLR